MNPKAKNAENTIPIAVSFFSLLFVATKPINSAAMTPNAEAPISRLIPSIYATATPGSTE